MHEVLYMISHDELILRLVIAALLGGFVGFERERLNWAAGLRTHMLVCLGAALIMIVSQYAFHQVLYQGLINLDPSRVAAQVVSGIGFLGAGTILFQKNVIRGLTTAASLWAVAAVGLATGGGLYLAAIFTTSLIYVILAGLKPLERKFIKKTQAIAIRFSAKKGHLSLSSLEEVHAKLNLLYGITRLQIERTDEQEFFYLFFKPEFASKITEIVEQLRRIEGVEKIEVIHDISEISNGSSLEARY